MNSMNFFSTIGTTTPPIIARSASESDDSIATDIAPLDVDNNTWTKEASDTPESALNEDVDAVDTNEDADEKTPLVQTSEPKQLASSNRNKQTFVRKIAGAFVGSFQVFISALLAPGRYLVACFYDEDGQFSTLLPVYRIGRLFSRRQNRRARSQTALSSQIDEDSRPGSKNESLKESGRLSKRSTGNGSVSASPSSLEGMNDMELDDDTDSPARHTRSKSASLTSAGEGEDEDAPKRSIRIKVLNEDTIRQRKQRRGEHPPLTAATIKSPTSPPTSLGLTKYPRSPAPPRPLIPRRQPSYTSTIPPIFGNTTNANQKTLIIDLDETLIHSMAKGGRMSTGHMVEVKLQSPVGVGGTILGPQVPILYYVHKRPHCDEFLRKVSKWYNLVVFTASVQEYADPVIDWLELERKYFSKRYYRQHCTYRNGAYIKDLGHVEPDLSNAIILDNSPLSYAFHQDNAVPIEGWISDPTDNNLLHLIPLFEALQYTTDVRSLLALRQGEVQR